MIREVEKDLLLRLDIFEVLVLLCANDSINKFYIIHARALNF